MEYECAANAALLTCSPCTFSADWECLVPLLTESQFTSIQPTNLIEFNIFNIFDFAKKNMILYNEHSSTSRNDLLTIQQTLAHFDNNNYYIFEFYTDGSLIDLGTE
ncbi:unnamed protein product [Rhizophagus irregularis]|nr:unnamed protein product [Rhizophagus irregularis]